MKVLLIAPPHGHMFTQGQPVYYAEEQAMLPPLGLLSIAGYLLEKAPRHEVRVLDMPVLGMDQKGLSNYLKGYAPDLVGINCLTNLLYDTLQTARTVKRSVSNVPVVLGGYHTQLFPGVDEISIGIGIHSGEAIVGNIGCIEKMDYSIIGDSVNLAARIESATKTYHAQILISESTYNLVRDHVEARRVASTKVKGREQTVELFELIRLKDETPSEENNT